MSDCGSHRRAWDFLRLIGISCEQAELYRLLVSQLDAGSLSIAANSQYGVTGADALIVG